MAHSSYDLRETNIAFGKLLLGKSSSEGII